MPSYQAVFITESAAGRKKQVVSWAVCFFIRVLRMGCGLKKIEDNAT